MDSNYTLPSNNQGSHAYFNRKYDPRGQTFKHYTDLKRDKLRADLVGTSKSSLLKDHIIYATGHSKHLTFNEIRRLVGEYGGTFVYHIEETGASTTEIIAEEFPAKKVEQYKKIPIVSAKWLVDTIRDNEIKPHFNYMLPLQKKMHEQFASVFFKVATQYNESQGGIQPDEFGFPDESNDPFSGLLEAPRVYSMKGPAPAHLSPEEFKEVQPIYSSSCLMPFCEHISTCFSSDVSCDPSSTLANQDIDHDQAPPFERYLAPYIKAQKAEKKLENEVKEKEKDLVEDPWAISIIVEKDGRIPGVAGQDDYINYYQQRSRLHLLSAFKSYIKLHFQKHIPPGPTPSVLGAKMMLHIDFDAFFISATLLDYPELASQPCCVSHGGKTSDVASANYPARKRGVKNGMWLKQAQEVCPELKVLPYAFSNYTKTSRTFYDVLKHYSSILIPTSMDEAILDISGLGDPRKIAEKIKQEIYEQTQLNVTIGLGENVLLAKMANKYAKPNGIALFTPRDILDKYGGSPVNILPGMGYHLSQKLMTMNIKTIGELRAASLPSLTSVLGNKLGITFYNYARGVDNRTVSNDQLVAARNSVSVHVNYGHRFQSVEDLFTHVFQLFKSTSDKLIELGLAGHTLSVQFNIRQNFAPANPEKYMGSGAVVARSKSVTVTHLLQSVTSIEKLGLPMVQSLITNCSLDDIRGSACTVTRLEAYDPDSGIGSSSNIEEAFMRPSVKGVRVLELTPQQMLELDLKIFKGHDYQSQFEILVDWLGVREEEAAREAQLNMDRLISKQGPDIPKFDDSDGRMSVLAGVSEEHINRWLAAYNSDKFDAWCSLGDLIATEITLQRDLEMLDKFIVMVQKFVQKKKHRKFRAILDIVDDNLEYFMGKIDLPALS